MQLYINRRQETAGSTTQSNTISNYPISEEGIFDSDSCQFTPLFGHKRDADCFLDQKLFTLEQIKIMGGNDAPCDP